MQLLSEHGCFGGVQRFYQFNSEQLGLPAKFSVYLPPVAVHQQQAHIGHTQRHDDGPNTDQGFGVAQAAHAGFLQDGPIHLGQHP